MRSKQVMHGCVGLLSLLGFVGVFTPHREFLAFFAFAVDFEYFFLASDEMLEGYMDRSAARAFCWGMVAVAACLPGFCAAAGGECEPGPAVRHSGGLGGGRGGVRAVGGLLGIPGEMGAGQG